MGFQHRNDFIGAFAQHKVAANLLMVVMLLAGVWGLSNLNVQFFPNFEVEVLQVRTVWTGASAEDVAGESDEARTMTEVGTKLDLARAYVDMGDPNGARSILEEVLNEGDEGQRQQAQQLLESMPSG